MDGEVELSSRTADWSHEAKEGSTLSVTGDGVAIGRSVYLPESEIHIETAGTIAKRSNLCFGPQTDLTDGTQHIAFIGTEDVHHFMKEHSAAGPVIAGTWLLYAVSWQCDDLFVSEGSCRPVFNIQPDEVDPLIWKLG
jgi:hypothetical protein